MSSEDRFDYHGYRRRSLNKGVLGVVEVSLQEHTEGVQGMYHNLSIYVSINETKHSHRLAVSVKTDQVPCRIDSLASSAANALTEIKQDTKAPDGGLRQWPSTPVVGQLPASRL